MKKWPLEASKINLVKALKMFALAVCLLGWSLVAAEKSPTGGKPADPAKGFKNVGVDEFAKMRADKESRILDVRTPREFATGHLTGAVNIDINGPDFEQKVAALDKSKSYLVHCAGGIRSAKACSKMSQLKFTKLYNLEGGLRAWEKAGKPVEK